MVNTLLLCADSSSTLTPLDCSLDGSLLSLYQITDLVLSNTESCVHRNDSLVQLKSNVQLSLTTLPAAATLVTKRSALDDDDSAENKFKIKFIQK